MYSANASKFSWSSGEIGGFGCCDIYASSAFGVSKVIIWFWDVVFVSRGETTKPFIVISISSSVSENTWAMVSIASWTDVGETPTAPIHTVSFDPMANNDVFIGPSWALFIIL